MRWSQLGFGRTSTTTRSQSTPRNLMGLKDGTNNLRAEDTAALAQHVWVGSEGPAWMRNGTYLVARRIRMLIETWDRASLKDQEDTIGRHKYSGAPIGRERASTIRSTCAGCRCDAHVRLSDQKASGQFLLRRGYSFTDGMDTRTGQLDAGLFFIASRATLTASSSRSSAASAPATRSTNTSSTRAARCSPCRRARAAAALSANGFQPDPPVFRSFVKASVSCWSSSRSSVSTYAWMPSRRAASKLATSSCPCWLSE